MHAIANHIHLKPLWLLLTGTCAGIIAAFMFQHSRQLQAVASLALASATLAFLVLFWQHNRRQPAALMSLYWGVGGCALGFALATNALLPDAATSRFLHHHTWQRCTISATVLRVQQQPDRWRMDVRVRSVNDVSVADGANILLRLHVGRGEATCLPGDRVTFTGKIRPPHRFGIPGEFDYPLYLAQRGIFASTFVATTKKLTVVSPPCPLPFRLRLERQRCLLGRTVAHLGTAPGNAWLLSLALGEKSRLSPQQRQRIAAAGIAHLFAISGLHLGLCAAMLYFLLGAIYRRSTTLLLWQPLQRMVPLLALPLLLAYVLLSGSALPTWRALMLLGAAALMLCSRRHHSAIDILGLVAWLILLMQPLALFSAAFQLSFSGVAALILCLKPWQQYLHTPLRRWLLLPLLTTTTASVATAPIALYHFHQLTPAALVNNLFAIPVIGLLAVPLTLIGTALAPLTQPPATALLQTALLFIKQTITTADWVQTHLLPRHLLYLTLSQHALVAALCLTLLCAIARHHGAALRGGCCCLLLLALTLLPRQSAPLELIPFSVGQGESMLLRAGHKIILVDGGGLYSKHFDVGERLLAPALGRLGIDTIDAVLLTHNHPDHRKGLLYVIKHFGIKQFWYSIATQEIDPALRRLLYERQIPMRRFPPGWTEIPASSPVHLALFVPPDRQAKMNDRCLVLYTSYGNDGILLTGDLQRHGVAQLLEQPLPGPITLLKLPHHGSRYSLPQPLLAATTPQWAVASVGYHNHYGFPHQQVLEALHQRHVRLLRTDIDGSVRLFSNGNGWQIETLARP